MQTIVIAMLSMHHWGISMQIGFTVQGATAIAVAVTVLLVQATGSSGSSSLNPAVATTAAARAAPNWLVRACKQELRGGGADQGMLSVTCNRVNGSE